MAKKIHSFWRLLLGSFITLLGFTACKTTRKVQQDEGEPTLYGPPPVRIVEPPRPIVKPNPEKEMRVLYGAPPVRVEKMPSTSR